MDDVSIESKDSTDAASISSTEALVNDAEAMAAWLQAKSPSTLNPPQPSSSRGRSRRGRGRGGNQPVAARTGLRPRR